MWNLKISFIINFKQNLLTIRNTEPHEGKDGRERLILNPWSTNHWEEVWKISEGKEKRKRLPSITSSVSLSKLSATNHQQRQRMNSVNSDYGWSILCPWGSTHLGDIPHWLPEKVENGSSSYSGNIKRRNPKISVINVNELFLIYKLNCIICVQDRWGTGVAQELFTKIQIFVSAVHRHIFVSCQGTYLFKSMVPNL